MEMGRGNSSFRDNWFMGWGAFYLISASLHALIFTFPHTPSFQRDSHAIPLTLLIAKDGSRQEPTPEGISMTSKKSVRPPVASKRQATLEQTESRKDTEALALIKRTEKAAQLNNPKAVNEKKPQKTAAEKRIVTESSMTSVSEPASLPTDQKNALSKLNRKDTVQKAPAIPSPNPTNSSLANTSDEIIVKKYNFQAEEITKLKVSAVLKKKRPQIKTSAKRSVADPTMTKVSGQVSFPSDHRSAVRKPNLQVKVQTVLSAPRPDPTNSIPADTGSETIVEKDNAPEAETAVEISALLEDSDEADITEPEELVSETGESEGSEERFRNETSPETTIALGSRYKDEGSRVLKRAGYVHKISPKYPERARREGWEGTTLLRVLIDRQGKSKVIQISQSSGFALLDGAAVKAVKKWRFYPAKNGNMPVERWVKVPILFRLVKDKN